MFLQDFFQLRMAAEVAVALALLAQLVLQGQLVQEVQQGHREYQDLIQGQLVRLVQAEPQVQLAQLAIRAELVIRGLQVDLLV